MGDAGRADLGDAARWARAWLFDRALPLWHRAGADRVGGGWFDRLDQSGRPVPGHKRCRVQARQVFVYAEAGRLGWNGPWAEAIEHGLSHLHAAFRRPDGLYRKSVTAAGAPVDDGFDLYDQAFVLLALASAHARAPRPALIAEAEALLAVLEDRLAHPVAGWEEDAPPRLPLRSNPHMHLLEALLAWVEAGGGERFAEPARAIVELARERLIDPATGAVGEYFDRDWRPMPDASGAVREPGHQFEWAYLLGEAARLLGGDHRDAIDRLYAFGHQHGVDRARAAAIFSVDASGTALDRGARLWAQTEWLRAALTLGREDDAIAAVATLRRYLARPVAGLWIDWMTEAGTMGEDAAPASSFYHLVTGLAPLIERATALENAA